MTRRSLAACRIRRPSGSLRCGERVSDFLVTGCSGSSLSFSRHALGPCHARLVLGMKASGGGVPGFSFLFGAALRFPCPLFFCSHARQRRSFRNLLGAKLFVGQIGRAPLGFSPFAREAGEFFLLVGPCSGGNCQFRRGEFAALGVRQRALLGVDPCAQRHFGQTFDVRLLRGGGLGGRLGSGSADCMFRGKAFGLQPPLCCGRLLSGLRQPRLGGGTGPLLGAGTRQCIGLGVALGVCCVRGGDRGTRSALLPLPLHIHQFCQGSAQTCAPRFGSGFKLPIATA